VAGARKRASARRGRRGGPRLRWLIVGAAVLIAFFYYRPLKSYLETRQTLERRNAEVRSLQEQGAALRRRLTASASDAVLAREARRLSLVRPGERLYIVTGIDAWRRAHARDRAGDR
jgi:septum formation initiator